MEFLPNWKLLAWPALRLSRRRYDTVSVSTTAPGPRAQACYATKVSEVSKRLGLLYQPPQRVSIAIGGGTPFNTWEVDGRRYNVPRRPGSKRWC